MTLAQRAAGCDTRSLALARLLLAGALLAHVAAAPGPWPARALTAVAGALLLIGLRTSLAAALAYVGLIATALTAGFASADPLLIALSLLAPFLPLGAALSVDAALDPAHAAANAAAPTAAPTTTVLSVATLALTLQMTLVLFASAESAFVAGATPAQAGALNTLAIASPALLLLPLPGGAVRSLALLALAAGIVLATGALYGGVSKITVLAGLAALLPRGFWDTLVRLPRLRPPAGLTMHYDRDCGFCRKICCVFRSWLVLGATPVKPAQADPAIRTLMERDDTWVVTDRDGTRHTRWRAVLLLLRRSPLWWPLGYALTWLGMGRWGDPFYAAIAASRGRLSRLSARLTPWRRERPAHGMAARAAVGVWLVLMLLFGFVHVLARLEPGSVAERAARALGLAQTWNLW